jgi:pimeloyl-ACP methyl ester carboxylesterase
MPVVELNGVHINYEEHGSPSGAPILLTHAYAATLQMWEPQFAALADYRVIAWDMRGHGGTDSPPSQDAYTEKLTVEDMASLLRHLGVERAVIGGLSLGGYISLEFQHAHPEMVRALVLCNTGPGYRKDDARAGWNDFAIGYAKRFEERGLDGLGRGIEIDATRAYQRSAQGLAFAGRGILTQRDAIVMEHLDAIDVPTLIVLGADDPRYKAGGDYLASKIPNARKIVVEQAAHAVNLYQPEAFNAAVLAFLRDNNI